MSVRELSFGPELVMRYALPLLVLLFALPASANETNQPPAPVAEVYACAGIEEDAARLACYDGAVGRMRQAESQGQFVAVDREQVQVMRRESFGLSLPNIANLFSRGDDDQVTQLEFQIARVIPRPDGRHVFVMSDGQRWSQIEPRRTSNVRVGDTVTVRRAALGSFMLSSERGGGAHRVRREN
jgi:hypothetical protein